MGGLYSTKTDRIKTSEPLIGILLQCLIVLTLCISVYFNIIKQIVTKIKLFRLFPLESYIKGNI